MALICSRCGAQEQEGMKFCSRCGTPLAAAPGEATPGPVGTGAGRTGASVPPGFVPQGYLPPNAPPAHRLQMGTILGVTLGLIGILAVIGVLTSHHGAAPAPPAPIVATTAPTAPIPATAVPQPTSPNQPTAAPQPTSPGQPTAAPQPTSQPQPTAAPQPTQTGGQTVSTSTFSLQVPASWQVVNKTQNEAVLTDPGSAPNGLDVGAGQGSGAQTAQSVLQLILSNMQQQYPDAKQCGDTVQATVGGVSGTGMQICFTFTPQGGTAFSAVDGAWGAASASGSTMYWISAMAGSDNQTFFNGVSAVVGTIQWAGGI
jgi:hypothetical protein